MIQMKQKVNIKMLLSISISASVCTTQIAPHYACNHHSASLTDCLNALHTIDMQDIQDEEIGELEKGYEEEEIIDDGEMCDDHAADIDEDIQGNSISDLPPNNVIQMAEDVEKESISRKAHE